MRLNIGSSKKELANDLELQRVEVKLEKSEAMQLVEKYQHLEEIIEKGGRSSHLAEDTFRKVG